MLGEPLLRLDETDSTNRVALEWADAPHGACVVARAQTGGRGRLGRSWSSPPDAGLYLSLVWRGKVSGVLALKSALGVARAVEKVAGFSARVKWPNDILAVDERGAARKIGGLLCETRGDLTVIGVGVNLNQSREELPPRLIFPASSLHIEIGRTFTADEVLPVVLREMDAVLTLEWSELQFQFERRCFGIGEVLRVESSETLTGIFAGVDEEGALILRTADGSKRVFAGDVSYL